MASSVGLSQSRRGHKLCSSQVRAAAGTLMLQYGCKIERTNARRDSSDVHAPLCAPAASAYTSNSLRSQAPKSHGRGLSFDPTRRYFTLCFAQDVMNTCVLAFVIWPFSTWGAKPRCSPSCCKAPCDVLYQLCNGNLSLQARALLFKTARN